MKRRALKNIDSYNRTLKEEWALMKCIGIFFSLLLAFSTLQGQTELRINAQFSDTPLTQALNQLSDEYALVLGFDPSKLAGYRVTVILEDQSLSGALDLLLTNAPLDYEILGPQQAIIRPAKGAPPPPPARTTLQITVTDANSGEPLEFATVRLGKDRGGYTDANGKIKLESQKGASDTLRISYIGYVPQVFPVEGTIYSVALALVFTPIEDIVIEDRSQLPFTPAGKGEAITVNPQKLQPLSLLGESDLFRTLQWAPGISGATESAAGLEIRGGTADHNLVLLDGMEIYNSGHFSGMFNAFNAQALNRARTIRGGFGAEYGGRISGVIDLSGVPESIDSFHMGASVNLLNANAYAQVPIVKKRISLFIAGRRSYNDVFSSPFYRSISDNLFQSGEAFKDTSRVDEEDSGIDVEPLATFFDVHSKLLILPSDRDEISLTGYWGGDNIDYSYILRDSNSESTTIDEYQPRNIGASLNWNHTWAKNLTSHLVGSVSSFESFYQNNKEVIEESDTLIYGIKQSATVTTVKGEASVHWHLSKKHYLEGGLLGMYHQTPVAISVTDNQEVYGDTFLPSGFLATAFAQHHYQPTPKFSLRSGLRLSYFALREGAFFEPRVSAVYEPIEGFAIKGSWGQYYQFLNPVQLNNQLKLGETFLILADEELEVEVLRSQHSIVGLSYRRPGFWAEAEFYHKSIDGLQTYTNRFDAALISTNPEDLITQGTGEILGMDLFARKQWGRYTGWVAYTLSQVQYEFESIDSSQAFPSDQDHRHELKLVNIVDLDPFQITLTWILASGRAYTRAIGIDTLDNGGGEEVYELQFAKNNSSRLPAYHRMDISFVYHFKLGKKARGSTGLTIFNLYNQENIRDRNYSIQPSEADDDEYEIISIDRELLRISPNVFFTIEF